MVHSCSWARVWWRWEDHKAGAGATAQRLRTLPVLAEDPGLVPSAVAGVSDSVGTGTHRHIHTGTILKTGDWRDGSLVKSTCCLAYDLGSIPSTSTALNHFFNFFYYYFKGIADLPPGNLLF